MSELIFKDKAGTPLKAGDLIVYGHALGRCAALQYGKVLSIQTAKEPAYAYGGLKEGLPVRLRVQGVEDTRWHAHGPKFKPLKPGTLLFEDRVLKVRRDQVDPDALAVLDEIEVPK